MHLLTKMFFLWSCVAWLGQVSGQTSVPTAAPTVLPYDLSKLESLNVTIDSALLDDNYPYASVLVCLVPKATPTTVFCTQTCKTATVSAAFSDFSLFMWNQNCLLKVTSADDIILFSILNENGSLLGQITHTMEELINVTRTTITYVKARNVAIINDAFLHMTNIGKIRFQAQIKFYP